MRHAVKKKGVAAYYVLAEAIAFIIGSLYHLTLPFKLTLCASLFFFLPRWRKNYLEGKLQKQRLSDAQIYMEQLLYAFLRQEKLLTAMKDVLVLFPKGKMHDTLTRAVELICYDYKEEDATKQGLKLIEEEYRNERLITIHRFLYKVERIGGSYDGITTLLLRDLNEWRQGLDRYQKACARERRNVRVAIGAVFLICMVTNYLLPDRVDISGNVVQMATTVLLAVILLVIYTTVDGRLSVNWLRWGEGESDDKAVAQYKRYIAYQESAEWKVSVRMAVLPLIGSVIFGFCSLYPLAVVCLLLGVFLLNQHRIGHALAGKTIKREIDKAFPHWLMELSLLLQLDNVQVSIAKTVSHAPKILQPALEELVSRIEKQPESAEPYLNFLPDFTGPQIQSAMKMLYALSVGNSGSEKEQLEELIARNRNLMNQAEQLQQEDSLAGMYLMFLTPALAGGMKLLVDMTIFMFAFFSQAALG